jgi:hypothetical protein
VRVQALQNRWDRMRQVIDDALQNDITIRFVRPGEAVSTPP